MASLQKKAEKTIEREFAKEILALLAKADKKSGEGWDTRKMLSQVLDYWMRAE